MESGTRRSNRHGIGATIRRLRALVRELMHADRYHPEEHYMRGPGPKTEERLRAKSESEANE